MEHNGWRDPIGGSRIKTLKMLRLVAGLFLVSFFTFLLPRKSNLGGKDVSLFSKEVNMLEV